MGILNFLAQKLGIWRLMAIGISLGFLILFAAYWTFGELALHESANRAIEERLVLTQMAGSQIDRVLAAALGDLGKYGSQVVRGTTDRPNPGVNPIVAFQGRTDNVVNYMAVLDESGQVIETGEQASFPIGSILGNDPNMQQPSIGQEISFWIREDSASAGGQRMLVAVPFFDESGQPRLAVGTINFDATAMREPLRQAAELGHTGHASLVDREGRNLAGTLGLPFLSPGEHQSFYREAAQRGEPVIDTVPFELDLPGEEFGEPHVMVYVPLAAAPWAIAVGGDAAETFAGVDRLRLGMIASGTAVLLTMLGVTILGTRAILEPIQEMRVAAEAIAGGDLETPLVTAAIGEIGDLAGTLEGMRVQLWHNFAELANLNETLELRVGEQTVDLRRQQKLSQRLLRHSINAQEEERARIARELHDEIGQTLTAVDLSMARLLRSLPSDAESRLWIEKVLALAEQAMRDLRRIIAALRPGVLDELGLVPALGWISDHTLRPMGVDVQINSIGLRKRLPGEIETVLFRIAQEAMNNTARHSGADQITIALEEHLSGVSMLIADNGDGWDQAEVHENTAFEGHGLGLAGMQERASLVGGAVIVKSAPGQGTHIKVIVPLAQKASPRTARSLQDPKRNVKLV